MLTTVVHRQEIKEIKKACISNDFCAPTNDWPFSTFMYTHANIP